jgi:hypothetical protein
MSGDLHRRVAVNRAVFERSPHFDKEELNFGC